TTSLTHAPAAMRPASKPRAAASGGPGAVAFDDESARDFDERLRVAAQRRSFRIVNVAAVDAPAAAGALARRLAARPYSLDRELWGALLTLAERDGVERGVIVEADRAGPAGEDWETLRALVKDAAREVLQRWAKQREPLVVRDLGLAARYGLREFVDGL